MKGKRLDGDVGFGRPFALYLSLKKCISAFRSKINDCCERGGDSVLSVFRCRCSKKVSKLSGFGVLLISKCQKMSVFVCHLRDDRV